MERTTIEEARTRRGAAQYGSAERAKVNEELLDELLDRVEALETGRNRVQEPQFGDGRKEADKRAGAFDVVSRRPLTEPAPLKGAG